MVVIQIDGKSFEAQEGALLIEVLRENGISVPALCHHPALKPAGACKLCVVEVSGKKGQPVAALSCLLKAKQGLVVNTRGDRVHEARLRAFQKLHRHAPQSKMLRNLAKTYGIELGPPPDGCIRCRLCIRVCKEVVGADALRMEKRGEHDYVSPVEGRCIGCGTCANICPTRVIQQSDRDGTRTFSIRDEVIGVHVLERCEACGNYFAPQRYLLFISEKMAGKHPDVKEHHCYCPTCAKLFSGGSRPYRAPISR